MMKHTSWAVSGMLVVAALSASTQGHAAPAELPVQHHQEITQHGITWRFDKPYRIGRFVTGDYWVVGPVNIVSANPAPRPMEQHSRVRSSW